jgi:hypothetical protein
MPAGSRSGRRSARGWEASLSDDVLGFGSRVNIYGISIAKYVGNFYIQLRHQNIVSAGSHSTGERLLARWYYTKAMPTTTSS